MQLAVLLMRPLDGAGPVRGVNLPMKRTVSVMLVLLANSPRETMQIVAFAAVARILPKVVESALCARLVHSLQARVGVSVLGARLAPTQNQVARSVLIAQVVRFLIKGREGASSAKTGPMHNQVT